MTHKGWRAVKPQHNQLEAKHDSGELHCPATAPVLLYDLCFFLFWYNTVVLETWVFAYTVYGKQELLSNVVNYYSMHYSNITHLKKGPKN